ncbi:MAG TPA: phosphopantothenoylcysteine decarboxylase, partial [Gemmatimonadales bacterium]|nr:phosphopantothenoylcysteine decarboxylase [Gemmatimonadales bacterium]
VRVLTNRSSGRMGYALADAAFARGADVLLITGPTTLPLPLGVRIERVETTRDLESAVAAALPHAHVLMMAAAPADFAPAAPAAAKQPRTQGAQTITLNPTPDILEATRAIRPQGCVCVGFALESGEDGVARARAKLETKGADLVVLNRADQPGAGPEADTNAVTLVFPRDAVRLPLQSKRRVAEQIWDAVEKLL